VCGNSARTDLCGGRLVTAVPTAIQGEFSNSGHPPGSRSSAKLNQTGSRSGNAQPLRAEFDEQCLRVFEIGSVEAFGKPTINRREKLAGLGVAALIAAEPGKARGSA